MIPRAIPGAAVAVLIVLASAGCHHDAGQDLPPPGGSGSGGPGPVGTSGKPLAGDAGIPGVDGSLALSDDTIAGVMTAANSGEVMVGNQASTQAQDPDVRAFAIRMVTDHSAANQALMNLASFGIAATDSDLSRSVATVAQETINRLALTSGAAFDATYAASELDQHQRLLQLLDDVLIPGAHDAQLRAELTAERATEATHLVGAQALIAAPGTPDAGIVLRD
jgi:putative membrane protein